MINLNIIVDKMDFSSIVKNHSIALFATCCLFLNAMGQTPYYSKSQVNWEKDTITGKVEHTLYLIGDAGDPDFSKPSGLKILGNHLKNESAESSVIFLGDNSYKRGVPEENSNKRTVAENNIQGQTDMLKTFQGQVYFIPGNHDWDRWSKVGWEGVKREETYIEAQLNRGNTFLPDLGCPGPVAVELSKKILLIIIDTQWWLHAHDRPEGSKDSCSVRDEQDFIFQLSEIIQDNNDKQIIITGHHPLYTNGHHGGNFPLREHLFPLTAVNPNLYIPLPVIGSIHPLYRKYISHVQDLRHPKYQLMKTRLLTAFGNHKNLIYAAGHEHNLQYFEQDNRHYIVSGSGSKITVAGKRHGADFSYGKQGFSKLLYMNSGEVWMEFWTTTKNLDDRGELVYRKRLKGEDVKPTVTTRVDFSDSTITLVADESFAAGKLKTFLWGRHYRKAWLTPIEVKVVDLKTAEGGLTPIKLGGGMQTKSLRLKNDIGNEYVFRSIQKDPTKKFLPAVMHNTLAADIMKDQISMAHPLGAFTIAPMAKAAGIYYKNSKLVYVPDDPLLGKYRPVYKNTLALFEERAGKNVSDYSNFGNPEKAISTWDLLDKLHKSHNHEVDQLDVLRNRLFDMWIGDWDRHDDQWRWAQFDKEGEKGKMYRAIPRDRDQVFLKADGLVLNIATRKFSPARKLQPFKDEIKDVFGLSINGRQVDVTFITELTEDQWIEVAKSLTENLTDSVIEAAIMLWPKNIYELDGDEIVRKLKSRRNHLVEYAKEYYHILSKEVEIVGSDKQETFEILRKGDGNTSITVYKKTKKHLKKEVIYSREFKFTETNEIRLFGFGENDRFELSGEAKKGIRVRIIGGTGDDEVVDKSSVKGSRKLTVVYDETNGVKIEGGKETKDLTSDDPMVNDYPRKLRFVADIVAPVLKFGYNVDDGVFVGGGVSIKKHKWKKTPYAVDHKILGSVSMLTGAFNFTYDANFYQAIKKWDLNLDLDVLSPNSATNFYGLGNETKSIENDDQKFYLVRFDQVSFQPSFKRKLSNSHTFKIGPRIDYVKVEKTSGRFISSAKSGLSETAFDATFFVGVKFDHTLNTTDNKVLPTKGIRWNTGGNWLYNMNTSKGLGIINSDLSAFVTINTKMKPTIALRIGGATIIDDYEFYQANTLGAQLNGMGRGNLRGFRRNRFSGRTSVYQNTELRLKIMNFKTYIVPGQIGILGFIDNARVWVDNDMSGVWHRGYGGGIWISPLKMLVFTTSLEKSKEDQFISFRMNFLF
jgi:Omp85 superfamily domain/Calcineurin-like phosphoesterase